MKYRKENTVSPRQSDFTRNIDNLFRRYTEIYAILNATYELHATQKTLYIPTLKSVLKSHLVN